MPFVIPYAAQVSFAVSLLLPQSAGGNEPRSQRDDCDELDEVGSGSSVGEWRIDGSGAGPGDR
jgi:hypothetical protein